MLFTKKIPQGFKILSESPVLVIQYCEKPSLYPIQIFLTKIILVLNIPIFIICSLLFIKSLVDAIPNNILEIDFWQVIQNYLTSKIQPDLSSFLFLIGFHYFIGVIISAIIIYQSLWSLWGISEFRVFPEKLIVSHQLLGISRTHLILRDSLLYFQEYQILIRTRRLRHKRYPCWTLKVITNQRIFFFFRSKIVLLDRRLSMTQSYWLGTVLADFYQVKFLPSPKRNRWAFWL